MLQAQKADFWTPPTSSRERDDFIFDFQVEAGWAEEPFESVIKTASQDVLLQAEPREAYFHPSAEHGASLWQGASCKPTSLAAFPVVKEVLFLSLSTMSLQFHGALKPWDTEILRGWAGTHGNGRKKPEGSLGRGREKGKCYSRFCLPSADFPWVVLRPPTSLCSIYKTIDCHVREEGERCYGKMWPLRAFSSEAAWWVSH